MNKQTERRIFDAVYDVGSEYNVIESEKPDFIIEHIASGEKQGVEITEHYFSNTSATISKSGNFIKNILTSKEIKSSEHRKHIEYAKMKLTAPDGTEEEIEGVISKAGEFNLYALKSIIEEKNNKFSGYDNSVPCVDLIICDRETIFERFDNYSFSLALMSIMRETICNSPFRSIMFLTSKDEKSVFIDLRSHTFFYTIKAIEYVIEKHKLVYELSDNNIHQNVCWLLRKIGISKISFDKERVITTGWYFYLANGLLKFECNDLTELKEPEFDDIVFDDKIVEILKSELSNLTCDTLNYQECEFDFKGVQ